MFVAAQFQSYPGKYVPVKDTVKGFRAILDGKYDALPEQAFYMIGRIEEAEERAAEIRKRVKVIMPIQCDIISQDRVVFRGPV